LNTENNIPKDSRTKTNADRRISDRRTFEKFLINPRLQVKFLSYVVLSGIGLSVCFIWSIYLSLNQNLNVLMQLIPKENEALLQIESAYHTLIYIHVIAGIVFVLIMALMSFIFSHKIAGPIYHIDTVLKSALSGNKEARVNLRPKDELHFLADSLNKLLEDNNVKKAS
jgi:methyl-accepting chemotaxis protein